MTDGDVVKLADGRTVQLMFRTPDGTWFVREVKDGKRGPGPWRLESKVKKVVSQARTTKNQGKQEAEFDPLQGKAAACCGADVKCIGCPREESAA